MATNIATRGKKIKHQTGFFSSYIWFWSYLFVLTIQKENYSNNNPPVGEGKRFAQCHSIKKNKMKIQKKNSIFVHFRDSRFY